MNKHEVEIERKYIIMKPDVSEMSAFPDFTESRIEQIYLISIPGITRRIRKRSMDGVAKYYETVKRRIDKMSSDENEREISAEEYAHLMAEIDPATRPIYKIRYTFRHGSHLFEVDVYPEWERTAIMEVELPSRDTPVDIPDFISVVREVTGVRGYSNAAMSREFPKEEEL